MAQYYGNQKVGAHLNPRSQDIGKHALFFGFNLNNKSKAATPGSRRKKSRTQDWKIMTKTSHYFAWKKNKSCPSCSDTNTNRSL